MKWLIFVVLTIASSLSYADRITDLQESVDELQMQLEDLSIRRDIDRSKKLVSQQQKFDPLSTYKVLADLSNGKSTATTGIRTDSVTRESDKLFSYIGVVHLNEPMPSPNDPKKRWTWSWRLSYIDCKNQLSMSIYTMYLDQNFKMVDSYQMPKKFLRPIPNENENEVSRIWTSYICKTYYLKK